VRECGALMRVAMISYNLPVPGQKRGGIERAAHTLAQGLASRGHQIVVFSHDAKPEAASYEVQPLPWKNFVDTWVGRRATMGYLGNLLSVLPAYGSFDAVIAHGDSLLLPLTGKPVLRVMHGSALGEAAHATSIGRFALQWGVFAQELLTALITPGTVGVSENARRDNRFIRYVIPHGVDSAVFHPANIAKTTNPSIVFVGTADGRKRGRFLLDVFQRVVRPAFSSATLTFVGPQGEDIPGVEYLSGITDEALADTYRRAWVYASPSTYEGFGLPYLEAMACGTPVIATSNPGSRELLDDGEYGRLVDDDAFGATIVDLLRNESARRALAAAGLRRARERSLTSMIDAYETLLSTLCNAHAGSVAST